MTPEDYLLKRVDDQINWYERKSGSSKRWYMRLSVMTIIFSVSIPFITNFVTAESLFVKHIISFIGICLAAISGLLVLMKYKDNWIEYRYTSEVLKHEKYLYMTASGVYAGGDQFTLFVQTIEDILSKEVTDWRTNRAANKEAKVEEPAAEGETPATEENL